jgi:hypothetical protein
MVVLFCVQVVQINNNEPSWKEKKRKNNNFLMETSKRYANLQIKQKLLIKKI